ncbi:Zn-dependent protease with chaperone function [Halobiforma haloterrestris]|uniref:Zn-dependent protease with chaperone function n=1 Tax=Natronobacterium haloterrestre TaxID=148448 RepID=A0A1I1DHR7_NATHA|nr:M48 family metalloprotease [Halobiforma haloterrestris]SFB73966.1 Zn-dependent protease with chaperone function [Halobiforma haloterrestris]
MNEYRLRLSLLVRMAVAVGVLVTLSIAVAVVVGLIGGVLGLVAWEWIESGFGLVGSFPGLSDLTALSPAAAAILAALGPLVVINWWPLITSYTPVEYLFRPTPSSLFVTGGLIGCLYLAIVDGSAAVAGALEAVRSTTEGLLVGFGLSGFLVVVLLVAESRREIRRLRDRLIADSDPVAAIDPEIEATVRRLATLASVPVPDVYVTETDRPESFTVGSGDSAVIVVSTGLCERLSDAELEAVLAHEVSHLANWDSRLMAAAIVPVVIADDWIERESSDIGDLLWNAVFGALRLYGQVGVAVLSRGREWHADAGAAALVGSPAPLAGALETLAGARYKPETDLREWERSIVALDVLPPALEDRTSGPFRTHPPTEARIRRLRGLGNEDERS